MNDYSIKYTLSFIKTYISLIDVVFYLMEVIKAKTKISERLVIVCKKSIPYVAVIDSFDISYFKQVFVFSLGIFFGNRANRENIL